MHLSDAGAVILLLRVTCCTLVPADTLQHTQNYLGLFPVFSLRVLCEYLVVHHCPPSALMPCLCQDSLLFTAFSSPLPPLSGLESP